MAGIKLVDRAARHAAGGGRPSTISRPSRRPGGWCSGHPVTGPGSVLFGQDWGERGARRIMERYSTLAGCSPGGGCSADLELGRVVFFF